MGLIREIPDENEITEADSSSEGVTDRFLREPKLSRAGSVDYGLNYHESRKSKAKRRREKVKTWIIFSVLFL